MRNWLFKLLFPEQYRKLQLIREGSPDFVLTAPEGKSFQLLNVYLVTNAHGQTINCAWTEYPAVGK